MDERTLASLPGGDLVLRGVHDLRAGIESIEALLVQVGATNLRLRGLDVPATKHADQPEHRLYARLRLLYGVHAHSRYNALVRRLVSFERVVPYAPQ